MNRYIKLEDAIDYECPFMEIWEDCIDCPLNDNAIEPCKMGKWLKSLPTIEIVRCKDCKHRYATGVYVAGVSAQYYVCDFMDAQFDENGYCHHGERKDNE